MTRALDPVAAHVAELERSLRGPARVRREIVREVRDGLADATDAYRRAGLDTAQAARLAVRDFGPVAEVADLYQDELAAGQGRRTALQLAVLLPALMALWSLLWSSGLMGADGPTGLTAMVLDLVVLQNVATALAAATALALVALTFRRTASPRRVAAAAAVTSQAAVVVCGGSAVVMNVAGGQQAWELLVAQPVSALAYAASVAVVVLLSRSASRTLRALHRIGEPS
ncbi:permease prefix domain 1-containing protein [Pseudonocardia lacus]|uniref:permease prefix domain 1-containing protein n=1 Tax=Pseudonocardia lacus TaxID=2835865 RepID=UPI001BDBB4EC|nr:permease prefix domain 1-containing protein [Pseudonocardia lacus]